MLGIAVGIGQTVVRVLVHQDERVEQHRLPGCLQRLDRLDHRLVAGCAAIDRPPVFLNDDLRVLPRQTRYRPRHAIGIKGRVLHLGTDGATGAAQIVSEPGHHQRRGLKVRQLLGHCLDGGHEIGLARRRRDVRAFVGAGFQLEADRRGGQRIFPGPGNQGHPLDPVGRRVLAARDTWLLGPEHLERELRDPVSERRKVDVLHHHIGRTAVGRHPTRPLDSLHRGVRQLIQAARVNPHVQIIRCHFLAIGPDTTDTQDLALADRDGKADGIAVLRGP